MNPADRKTTNRRRALRRAATVTVAALGPVVAIAVLTTMNASSDGTTILRFVGAAIALGAGLTAVLELQRTSIEERARGRTVTVASRPPGSGAAIGVAVATVAVVVLVSTVIELVAVTASAEESDESGGAKALREARDRRGAEAPAVTPSGGGRSDVRLVGPGSGNSGGPRGAGGGVGDLLSGAEVLRIRPVGSDAADRLGRESLHLRGFAMDAYDAAGRLQTLRGSAVPVADGDDGRADGWIEVAPARPPGFGDELVLDVRFVPESNGIVFAPSRLSSVRAGAASRNDAQASLTLSSDEAATYRTRSFLPTLSLADLRGARAERPADDESARTTRVPTSTRIRDRELELNKLRAFAGYLTRGAKTDADRVLSIVQHLRTAFSYEIYDTSFLTPEEFEDFRERGAGSCTHFASFAVLLLRLEGIPARVAAGYVAREVDPLTGEWVVRERDGHAWIEVHFDRFGWLPFDPTPGDPEVGGTETGWSPLTDEASVDEDVQRRRAARTSGLGQILVGGFNRLSARAGGALEAASLLLFGAVVALLVVVLVRRRRAAEAAEPLVDDDRGRATIARADAPSRGVEALLEAIRSRGWRQGRTVTPTSFARGLERAHPEARGLGHAIRLVLRRACSGVELGPTEERRLEDLGSRIRDERDRRHGEDGR